MPIMPHMVEEHDFSFFLEPFALAFSMAKETIKPCWQSLYYPLQTEVWVSIAVVVFVVYAVFMLVGIQFSYELLGHVIVNICDVMI